MKKIACLLIFILLMCSGLQVLADENKVSSERVLSSFNELFNYILNYHVDEQGVVDLIRGAMDGMVEILDQHSTYMSEEEYKELQLGFEGHFGGIGIVI